MKSALLAFSAPALLTFSALAATPKADPEAEYYRIITIPTPEAGGKPVTMEAGALLVLGPDKIACASRLGDIWIGEGVTSEAPQPTR